MSKEDYYLQKLQVSKTYIEKLKKCIVQLEKENKELKDSIEIDSKKAPYKCDCWLDVGNCYCSTQNQNQLKLFK